ncbi:MAG TPA: protein-glutamate O-methyltransferase CheR [Mycobacteriales bacterium]|jgi:chemotaxis protein methyltransferase CheR|nr:protein-glutamate O-methyltransferase CheR [Mycobacteriales bacterium]
MALTESEFDYVRRLVYRESAIVLAPGKEYLVEARLAPLARAAEVSGVNAYVAKLMQCPDRATEARVVDALTTNETSWYRDGAPFEVFRSTVLPALLADRPVNQPIRIWSAACSTGQEPYTLSMILGEQLGSTPRTAEIMATDLSDDALARAKAGRYSQLEINRGLPAAMLVKHFRREGTEWVVGDAVRSRISFRKFNLISPAPPSTGFDVVFLRNVLIYFDAETRRGVLRRIRAAMRPDGWLFLGAAETTIGIDDDWDRVVVGRTSVHRARAPLATAAAVRRV